MMTAERYVEKGASRRESKENLGSPKQPGALSLGGVPRERIHAGRGVKGSPSELLPTLLASGGNLLPPHSIIQSFRKLQTPYAHGQGRSLVRERVRASLYLRFLLASSGFIMCILHPSQ